MAERADAQFPKIRIRKIGQNGEIDVVLDECGCVPSKPELFEPTGYFRRRAARSLGLFSIFLVRFHGYRQPSPARLGPRPPLRSDRNFARARSSSAAPNRPNATASAARKTGNFRVSLMARPCETQSSTKTRRKLPGLDPEQYRGKTKLMLLGSVPEGRMDASAARFAHHCRNLRLQPKTALSPFPPVRKAYPESLRRVD